MAAARVADSDALAHGLAGALGGIFAAGLFFPLEVLRTRLQVGDPSVAALAQRSGLLGSWRLLRHLARTEGVVSWYQGFSAVLVTTGIAQFLYFCTYQIQKQFFASYMVALSPLANLAMAASAGVVTVLVTTPLWLVNTRMKLQQTAAASIPRRVAEQPESPARAALDGTSRCGELAAAAPREAREAQRPYRGLLDGLLRVWREEGLPTLWDGTTPSLILVSSPSIQWAVYEFMKAKMADSHLGGSLSPFETLLMGAFSKVVATLATYPLQVAQAALRYNHGTALQQGDGDKIDRKRYVGTLDCLRKLYAVGGVRGLFRGLETKLVQTVCSTAFHVLCYEELLDAFVVALGALRST